MIMDYPYIPLFMNGGVYDDKTKQVITLEQYNTKYGMSGCISNGKQNINYKSSEERREIIDRLLKETK